MTTISARVEDSLKDTAEDIATSLGLSLSAVINVFLKRFVAENGFPFPIKIQPPMPEENFVTMTSDQITQLVKKMVAEVATSSSVPPTTYLDPVTGTLVTHNK